MPRHYIMAAVISLLVLLAVQDPEFEVLYLAHHGRRQHTAVYDFDGDGRADILNASVDYDVSPPVRWLLLHRQTKEGRFRAQPDAVWKLSDRAAAMMYGDFVPGGGVEIAFAAPDGVYYHPWVEGAISETPRKLLHLRTFFNEASDRGIPAWWTPQDLDADGRHDIVLPVPDGYRVYFQTEPGLFGSISTLEADLANPADRALALSRFATSNDFIASFLASNTEVPRLAITDIDGDGRADLASIEGAALTVFFQKEPRVYSSRRGSRVRFTLPALDDVEKKDTVSLSLVTFVDLDGDKLADLVVTKIQGTLGFLESIKTNLYIHRGTGRGNFTVDSVIKIDGVSIDPAFADMNGDGTQDCIVSRMRTDLLAQAVKAALLGDLAVQYEIFQFERRTGRFVETAVYAQDVFVTSDDIQKKGAASMPMIYVQGDHSGDGRADMAYVNPKTGELEFRRGVDSAFGSRRFIGFESTPFWRGKLARHPYQLAIQDVNGDAIADVLLMHHGTVGLVLSKRR